MSIFPLIHDNIPTEQCLFWVIESDNPDPMNTRQLFFIKYAEQNATAETHAVLILRIRNGCTP